MLKYTAENTKILTLQKFHLLDIQMVFTIFIRFGIHIQPFFPIKSSFQLTTRPALVNRMTIVFRKGRCE